MEPISECQVDLFADKLPSIEEIKELSGFLHSSESNLLSFREQLEAGLEKSSPKANLASGIGLYIAGRTEDATQKLQKAKDCKEKYIYLALAFRRVGNYGQAIEMFEKARKYEADALQISLEKAATYRCALDFESASKELKGCANFANVSADYHYQLGHLQEEQGFYGEAMDNYKSSLELVPGHRESLFRLAYRSDLLGDEEAAIDYYKQIVTEHPVYVSVLLNLAVLYEDRGEFEKAAQCIDKVLKYHPNHQRAIMFKKDIESSKTMYYDEEKEKKKDLKVQILETPISDFELSVRSRNCLKKMNINTIGDLLNITEVELLSYKNFGETSLREIKIILESKGMHLGMALEEEQRVSAELSETDIVGELGEDEALLSKPVDDLQLSVRARKCLQQLNLRTISELIRRTDAELLGCKNFGVTSLNEIKRAIGKIGLSLRSLD